MGTTGVHHQVAHVAAVVMLMTESTVPTPKVRITPTLSFHTASTTDLGAVEAIIRTVTTRGTPEMMKEEESGTTEEEKE